LIILIIFNILRVFILLETVFVWFSQEIVTISMYEYNINLLIFLAEM
jgi:hypothetical protein